MGAGASWNAVQRQRSSVADVHDVIKEVRAALRDRERTKTRWEIGSSAPAGLDAASYGSPASITQGGSMSRDPRAAGIRAARSRAHARR
jgi:hypothetical protein